MRGTSPAARSKGRKTGTHGIAFLIEALVILAFLMACMAVFTKLFAAAQLEGLAATHTSQAVIAATNRAEQFSANPTDTSEVVTANGLRTVCEVDQIQHGAGVLYNATIIVYDESAQGAEIYRLETSRYVSGAGDF